MKINWSARSKRDLRDLKVYIGGGSSIYAKRFVMRIMQTVERLYDFPEVGRRVVEAGERDDIRELIFQGYRIIYLLELDSVYILTVIHGSRDLEGMMDKPWNVQFIGLNSLESTQVVTSSVFLVQEVDVASEN